MQKKRSTLITVVMPAYNAERTVEKIYQGIPKRLVNQVILVDDASSDNTTKVSRKLDILTITHKKNKGYGGNQKTCYNNALKFGTDFVIMLHADGQYNPSDIPLFVSKYKKGADVVLGSRFLNEKGGETPGYKKISIKFITKLFNLVLGLNLTEANTGYRGYSRKFLETVPFLKNGDGYIFDPQMIIQAVNFGFEITEVPVTKKYNPERIEPNFRKSLEHGLENIKLLLQHLLKKFHLSNPDFLSS